MKSEAQVVSSSSEDLNLRSEILTVYWRILTDGNTFWFQTNHHYRPTPQSNILRPGDSCSTLKATEKQLKVYLSCFTTDYVYNEDF